jgi:hypothetical protein
VSKSTPQERKAKAALILAAKLDAAGKAMNAFIRAGEECGERAPYADDQRITMSRTMFEYSAYLLSVFDK